jgi:hypothetical protein
MRTVEKKFINQHHFKHMRIYVNVEHCLLTGKEILSHVFLCIIYCFLRDYYQTKPENDSMAYPIVFRMKS